jgi:hypothetical protein
VAILVRGGSYGSQLFLELVGVGGSIAGVVVGTLQRPLEVAPKPLA